MDISPVFFYSFAAVAIAFSAMVVLKKSPIASALSLVIVFFCFGAFYAMLDAHLVAALQILVYAGAIMVLFVFVIMLLNVDAPSLDTMKAGRLGRAVIIALTLGLFSLFVWAFKETAAPAPAGAFTLQKIQEAGGNTRVLSELMFSEYILPFELTSVLLLGAIVGAVAIAKRRSV
ncbi:NADH-quinone oxidoreductase subunit J [Bdellovibrionota bacterium FG-2]